MKNVQVLFFAVVILLLAGCSKSNTASGDSQYTFRGKVCKERSDSGVSGAGIQFDSDHGSCVISFMGTVPISNGSFRIASNISSGMDIHVQDSLGHTYGSVNTNQYADVTITNHKMTIVVPQIMLYGYPPATDSAAFSAHLIEQ